MTDVRASFESQSRGCAKLGSPFMGRLMALFAERLTHGNSVADRVLNWPGDPSPRADNVPLRLAGALHALARSGHPGLAHAYPPNALSDDALWACVCAAMDSEAAFILDRLQYAPQTNEVRRAAVLIPAFHLVARRFGKPLNLIELGCSAGLNLRADRFGLSAGGCAFGPEDAAVRLAPDWNGPVPSPAPLDVDERLGIDLSPLDPATEEDRLLSYIWPDQPDRITLTKAAIAEAAETPARLVRADAADWLRDHLALAPGRVTVLFHTIAWQYLPKTAAAQGEDAISRAGNRASGDAPLVRIAMEAAGPHAALTLQVWPAGVIITLGRADYHGRWVTWEPGTEEALEHGT